MWSVYCLLCWKTKWRICPLVWGGWSYLAVLVVCEVWEVCWILKAFCLCQYLTFGYPLGQANFQSDIPPQVEASSDQEQYSVRSSWYLVILWFRLTFSEMYPQYRHIVNKNGMMSGYLDSWLSFGSDWLSFRHTPSRNIQWPRMVLPQVILMFGYPLGQADFQSDIPPSRGI